MSEKFNGGIFFYLLGFGIFFFAGTTGNLMVWLSSAGLIVFGLVALKKDFLEIEWG